MKPKTRFGIITAVRDGARWLDRLLDSLQGQTYGQWVCMVQDGGSTDGTLDLLARRGDARIKVASEPDAGVYDAWNKALDRMDRLDREDREDRAERQDEAGDQWLLFLGADDALADAYVLARAARALSALPEKALFAQAGLHLGKEGRVRETLARSRAEVFRFFVGGMPLLMPAVFCRRALFKTARFDPAYRIAGDFAFVAERLTPDNLALLPFVASYMEAGGLSSAVRSRPLLDAERRKVLSEIVLPRARDIIQACIDTYGDTGSPLDPRR